MLLKYFFLLSAAVYSVHAGKESLRSSRNPLQTSFECILFEVAAENPNHDTTYEHVCFGKGKDGDFDVVYEIDDNNDAVSGSINGLDIMRHSGRYKITMTNVFIDRDPVITTTRQTKVTVDDLEKSVSRKLNDDQGENGDNQGEDEDDVSSSPSQSAAPTPATRSMVIFRVTSPDAVVSKTSHDIADAFFGTSGKVNNLGARYYACSAGKMTFVPGSGENMTNGVAELYIDMNILGTSNFKVQKAVTDEIIARYGSALRNDYDHVVYALPRGVSFGKDGGPTRWLAYAFMNSYLSVYHDDNVVFISNQVHETGHNLGLMHSNHGTQKYGDQSGAMGYGYESEDFPEMCFNAAKTWKLGWFADRSLEITHGMLSVEGFAGTLDAFVDYDKAQGDEYALFKIGTKYLIYNKKKGANLETQEFANTVTITDAPTLDDYSDAVAALGEAGQTYDFNNTDGDLVTVELCSVGESDGVDRANVAIYLSRMESSCGAMAVVKNGTLTTASFECVIVEVATEMTNHDTNYEHACIAQGDDGEYDMRFQIDDNNGIIVNKMGEHGLNIIHASGRYKVTMTNVVLAAAEPVVSTTPSTEVTIEDLGDKSGLFRRLGSITGTKSIVIIRVTTNDGSASKSKEQIANSFFGTGGDSNTLRSRYLECSMGKLEFVAGTGHDFVNGVAELTISHPSSGINIMALQAQVTTALIAKYGSSLRDTYDHVVYSVPRGTTIGGTDGWLAFAYMNSYLSVYNDQNIVFISNQVHETGHNLGLMHSNHGSQKYGDQSGTMGYGYGQDDFPKMCFNAAKSWQLGWYDDKSKTVTPDAGSFTGDLSAFVDYKSVASDGFVTFKVGTLYLFYNKAKGINSETQEFANQVTITNMPYEGDFSDAVANLGDNGQSYDFTYNGAPAKIQLCSKQNSGRVDFAKLSIYLASDGSSCDSAPTSDGPSPTEPTGPPPTNPPQPTGPPPTNPPEPRGPEPTNPPEPRGPEPTAAPVADPTAAPVTAMPTLSPTFASCSNTGEMEVTITIKTDSKPNETTWYFKKMRGTTYGSGGPYTEAFHTYIYKFCVSSKNSFEFHLEDSGNDGIQGEFGQGFYTTAIDGETYSSGGNFKSEEVDYIHGKCSNATTSRVQFILLTGDKPEDVTWNLKSDPEGIIDHTGGPWNNGKNANIFVHACLLTEACYDLTVYSANGNGLTNGNVEVNWDDDNVGFSKFGSGSEVSFRFGDCEPDMDERRQLHLSDIEPEFAEYFLDPWIRLQGQNSRRKRYGSKLHHYTEITN